MKEIIFIFLIYIYYLIFKLKDVRELKDNKIIFNIDLKEEKDIIILLKMKK